MLVVSDTSPIVALARLDHVDLLPAVFDLTLIPPAVAAELIVRGVLPTLIERPPHWLEIRAPQHLEPIAKLHKGELEAISLARENVGAMLLIDERHGRRAAQRLGIRIIGTVGLLEVAAKKRLIDLGETFERLKQSDFWVSAALLDERLEAFERNNPPQGE